MGAKLFGEWRVSTRCPRRIALEYRRSAAAGVEFAAPRDRIGNESLRAFARVGKRVTARQECGDRGGKRATGAVGFDRRNSWDAIFERVRIRV